MKRTRVTVTLAVATTVALAACTTASSSGVSRQGTAQSATVELLPAVSQQGGGISSSSRAKQVAVAQFTPARPGRAVTFKRASTGATLAKTKQGADGTAYYSYSGTVAGGITATTAKTSAAASFTSAAATSTGLTPSFDDEFSGRRLNPTKWKLREANAPSRKKSRISSKAVKVKSGSLRLSIIKAKKKGHYLTGMVSTSGTTSGTAGGGNFAPYGMYAARIKYPQGRGQHGSFWLQSPTYGSVPGDVAKSGAEIDVTEFFGKGYPKGGLGNFLYYANKRGDSVKTGGVWSRASKLIGKNDAWWKSYHVFSVKWTPTGYTFYVDGKVLYRTKKALSKAPEFMVLSLLASDWEIPKLDTKSLPSTMYVDWTKAWAQQ